VKSFLTRLLSLFLMLSGMALVGCAGEKEEGAPSPSAAATAAPERSTTPTAIAGGPPELHPIVSGRHDWNEPGVVITEAGDELRVSLSAQGTVWRFQPDETWTVKRSDGTVLLSGTAVQEAGLWEQAVGFVHLDDGRLIAYSFDIDANWNVYPAEEMCRLAAYWAERDGGSEVARGFVDVLGICVDKLGITPDTSETP
jgi:hypothetical protein